MKVSELIKTTKWSPFKFETSLCGMVQKCYRAPHWVEVSHKIISTIGTSLSRWEVMPERKEQDIHDLIQKLDL